MNYIVYLTLNKINNKFYIGVHQTTDLAFDGYLGCGIYANKPKTYKKCETPIKAAVSKYGPKNFHRITLRVFDNIEDALNLERLIVDEAFIKSTNNYNVCLGGGVPPLLTKTVYQYDSDGSFIKEWQSIKSVTDFYKCNKDRITMVIKDKRSFNNNYWSFIKVKKLDLCKYRTSFHEGKIKQYSLDGVLLNEFDSVNQASISLDIDKKQLANSIYSGSKTQGYYFTKKNDIDYILNNKKIEFKIYQYTVDGKFIKEYKSLFDVKKTIKIKNSSILRAIKNNGICNNYRWSDEKHDSIDVKSKNRKAVKVFQYSIDGTFIKTWDTINECLKEFPGVRKVLSGERESTKGFIFKYQKS